jgi:hypothetical protein
MTTHAEGQEPIWSVSGLAVVVSGPVAGDAAMVSFNRARRTHAPSAHELSHAKQRQLDQWGYVVVPDVGEVKAAAQLVRSLGDVIAQRGGVEHDVTLPHTAASGRVVSPAYVAVHGRHQHLRGGGRIRLLDVRRLIAALDEDELALMTDVDLHFPGPAGGIHTTMLSTDASGDTVTRFNHDLLTNANPLGEAGRRLANRVGDLFRELSVSVRIPDGALLIWDNQRMLHAMSDRSSQLTRFWTEDRRRA